MKGCTLAYLQQERERVCVCVLKPKVETRKMFTNNGVCQRTTRAVLEE